MSKINVDFLEEDIDEDALLISLDDYLTSGVHIGTTVATKFMKRFIYKIRADGLSMIDIRQTDERLRNAAKLLSGYDPAEVVVVSTRQYGTVPISTMSRLCNFTAIPGRFIPGTFTNHQAKAFLEPEIVIITDPKSDKQAMHEAKMMNISTIALCDSDNSISNVDYVIPSNNKGRKSLARVYMLLTIQVLRERGELTENESFDVSLEDFSFKLIKT